MNIEITLNTPIEEDEVISLYEANEWSSAKKPKELLLAGKTVSMWIYAGNDH